MIVGRLKAPKHLLGLNLTTISSNAFTPTMSQLWNGTFNTSQCSNRTYIHGQDLQLNGDIDGPGVIFSFIGTGILVFLILLFNYMIAHDPEAYPFPPDSNAERGAGPPDWWKPNPIDVLFLSWVRKLGRKLPASFQIVQPKKVEAAFNRVCSMSFLWYMAILIMCDIQIFTGIAVLISGFVQLPKGIQTYHWLLIVYVAWFSSTTHISAMTVLRSFLSTRRAETCVRFGLMTCLLVMLITALVPTTFFDWSTGQGNGCSAAALSSPTICVFDMRNKNPLLGSSSCDHPTNPATQSMALSLILLVFGFFSRSVKLFKPLSKAVHLYFRQPVSKFAQLVLVWLLGSTKICPSSGTMTHRMKRHRLSRAIDLEVLRQPCVAAFLSVQITADLVGSMLAEIYWLLVLVAWGTMKLLMTRSLGYEIIVEQQDVWSFGQILPILLLAAPVWSLVAAFVFGDRNERPQYLNEAQENVLMPASAAQASLTYEVTYSAASSTGASSIIEHNFDSALDFTKRHYISCSWIGPCLTFPCLIIVGVTVMQFIFVPYFSWSLLEFWVTVWGVIYVFALVYPFSLQCTILLGLVYEGGFLEDRSTRAPPRSKASGALLWLTILIIWAVFLTLWAFFLSKFGSDLVKMPVVGPVFGFRYWVTIAGTAALHVVYASAYFWQTFRKRSKLG